MTIFSKPQKYQARILLKEQLTETVYFIKYQFLENQELEFIAGQTFMLTVAPGIHRAMSIASTPQNKSIIESFQDVAPMGVGSKWLLDRQVGDIVEMMAPLGRFTINSGSLHKRIFVATGTGMAPIRSMLFDQSPNNKEELSSSFYWGLRFKKDIYISEEFYNLEKKRLNFKFYLTLSKPDNCWTGLIGHVTEHVMNCEKDFANCDFYLCGNKNMIMELSQRLKEKGITKEQLKFDPYY